VIPGDPVAAELGERLQQMSPRPWLPAPDHARLRPLARGAYHLNYLLDCDGVRSVLRLSRSSQWGLTRREQLGKEYATLHDVAGSGVTPRPVELLDGDPPILVESFVAGTAFSYTAQQLHAAGQAVAHVHRQPVSAAAGMLPTTPGSAFLLEDGTAWLDHAERRGHAPATTAFLRARHADLPPAPAPDSPCVVHTDLIAANLLATGDGVAILDWEGARIGSPAWDLAYFLSPVTTRWGPGHRALLPDEQQTFLSGYAAVAAVDVAVLETAVRRWLPFVVFRALAWCVGFEATAELELGPRADLARFTGLPFVEQVWHEAAGAPSSDP
jgi:Ser/Thr protein kinase RdoA (MazF antagonist)